MTPPYLFTLPLYLLHFSFFSLRLSRQIIIMKWVIYTDSLSSILAIENNRENHPILNQIYDILAELQNQGKQITICTSAHIGVKGNEEADKAAKLAIDILGMTNTHIIHHLVTHRQ